MLYTQSAVNTSAKDNNWEDILVEWSKNIPLKNQGVRLSVFLSEVMPTELHILLDDISRCFQNPEDTLRWQIFNEAQKIGLSTPVGALALACFWSSGSMAPIGLEPIYPAPHLSQDLIQCVLIMCVNILADAPAEGTYKLLSRRSMMEDSNSATRSSNF